MPFECAYNAKTLLSLENQECIMKEIGFGITHRHISNPYGIVEEKKTVKTESRSPEPHYGFIALFPF